MSEPDRPADSPADNTEPVAETADQELGAFDALRAAAELDDVLGAEATGQGGPTEASDQLEELEQQVADLGELMRDADDARRRAEARADNAEKEVDRAALRLAKDADRKAEERVRKVVISFLEVLDDLDRALESARGMDHNPAVVDGVELVQRSFLKALAKHGVAPMDALDVQFDPNIHEAMTAFSVEDAEKVGKVVRVLRPGYTIGDEVLRPAGVAVGKKA